MSHDVIRDYLSYDVWNLQPLPLLMRPIVYEHQIKYQVNIPDVPIWIGHLFVVTVPMPHIAHPVPVLMHFSHLNPFTFSCITHTAAGNAYSAGGSNISILAKTLELRVDQEEVLVTRKVGCLVMVCGTMFISVNS